MVQFILSKLEKECIKWQATPPAKRDNKRLRLAILCCDCLGDRLYLYSEFLQAADSRFVSHFDYYLTVQAASKALGWDGHCNARQYATIHMMARRGPDLSPIVCLILQASRLERFADELWEADVDETNMHDLSIQDVRDMGMSAIEAVRFYFQVRLFRPNEYDDPPYESETDSYESAWSLPKSE